MLVNSASILLKADIYFFNYFDLPLNTWVPVNIGTICVLAIIVTLVNRSYENKKKKIY